MHLSRFAIIEVAHGLGLSGGTGIGNGRQIQAAIGIGCGGLSTILLTDTCMSPIYVLGYDATYLVSYSTPAIKCFDEAKMLMASRARTPCPYRDSFGSMQFHPVATITI